MHATQGKTGGGGSTSGSSGGSGKSTTKQAASSARSGSSTSSSSGGRGYFEGGGIRGNMADFAKHARNFRGNLSPTWEVASPSSMTAEDVRIDGDANIDVARFRDAVGGQDGMTNRRTRQAMHHMTDTQVIRATMTADSGFRERQQYEAAGRKTARNRRGGSIDGRGMRNSIRRTRRSIRATRDSISGMNSALNSIAWSILPTNMYKWYSILAMLLPLIIAMAVQLAGVATAMLSVVGAGAAMMGIGLLGFGENMAESMEMARRELRQFKRDMFGAFQPVAQEFAPITQEVMNTLSFRIQSGGLVDALSGLKQFEDTFQRAIDGIIGWLGRAINTMVQFEPILSQMAMRFGQIAGNRIISFLSWLTEEAYMNQEAFISFAGALADALHGLYNIIMVAAKLVAVFSPIIWAVKWLTEHIRDDMAMALMFFTMVGWGAVKMLLAILAVGTKLSQLGLLSTLQAWGAGLLGLAGKALVAAKSMGILASVAAATLGILTLGAGLVVVGASLKAASNVMSALLPDEVSSGGPSGGAGFSSSGFSSGDIGGSGGGNRGRGPPTASGSSGMKIIVQGDMVEGSAQRIEDKIAQGSREQIRLDKEQNE